MENNINITPEMINNLANIIKNSQNNNSTIDSSESTPNSNINLNDIISNFSQNTNDSSSSQKKDSNAQSIDMNTILKIKSIIETLNNNDDSNSKLLYSLKPYLRKSKQEKLDQYINIIKLSKATELFK